MPFHRRANLTKPAIAQFLPTLEQEVTKETNLPSTAILSYYNNAASRVKQTIEQLKLGAVKATLSGKFNVSLNTKELYAVSPASLPLSGWKVGGKMLEYEATEAFSGTNTTTGIPPSQCWRRRVDCTK